MTVGRKRKQGKRTKSGQLSRAGRTPYDNGTARSQTMRALYGDNWHDPIGRAYEAGLLGQGAEAKSMLDMARSVHTAYWRAYAVFPGKCTLGERSGSVAILDHERAKRREIWLNDILDSVRPSRACFDGLVIDVNPDHGPPWLDRIIHDRRTGKTTASDHDHATLRAALDALEIISF